jgi:hypothetical protein
MGNKSFDDAFGGYPAAIHLFDKKIGTFPPKLENLIFSTNPYPKSFKNPDLNKRFQNQLFSFAHKRTFH